MFSIYVTSLTGVSLELHFSLHLFSSDSTWNNKNTEEEIKDNTIQKGTFDHLHFTCSKGDVDTAKHFRDIVQISNHC